MRHSYIAFVIHSLCWSSISALRSTAMDQLFNSKCAAQLVTMSEADVSTLDRLIPPSSFIEHVHKHMQQHKHIPTLLLLEVDLGTLMLALNHIECLRISRASIVPFVVAYEAGVCEKIIMHVSGGCFFDEQWSGKLISFYSTVPGADKRFNHGYRTMLGRMMTTVVALCGGYNVFLSDSDIVYYRDPMDYVFHHADVMITSTILGTSGKWWGGFFYSDQPNVYATMNNGVVLFKSTEVVRNLHLTMATEGIRGFLVEGDPALGFLQVIFNQQLVKHKLSLSPCSKLSDPTTKKFSVTNPVFGGNRVGECFDCYNGTITWTSNVIRGEGGVPSQLPLHMGVFPMERYVSHCNFADVQELRRVTATAAAALKSRDSTGWGWGEDTLPAGGNEDKGVGGASASRSLLLQSATNKTATMTANPSNLTAYHGTALHRTRRLSQLLETKTRPLSAHANCIDGTLAHERFSNKELLLKEINSWYL